MKNYNGWILFIALCLTQISFSQTEMSQQRELRIIQATLESQKIAIPTTIASNQVFIQQIGNDNKIDSRIKANKSNTNLFQNGSGNELFLKVNADDFKGNLQQIGDNNKIYDNIYAPNEQIELNLTQRGDNNKFQKFGSNSISNKLKFETSGNSQTIIVRNF